MLSDKPMVERVRLAEQLRGLRRQIAEKVTEAFLARYPDWVARYGERARRFGIEDAIFHQDFLAAAIETGDARAFGQYLRWTAGVLESRGIAPRFLHENVEQIATELASLLPSPLAPEVAEFVQAGIDSARAGETGVSGGAVAAGELSGAQALYLQAILHGQRQAAAGIADETVRQGHGLPDVYADILQDSMYEVGRLWETNRITVAQEHMATAITQYVIAHLYPLIQRAQPPKGRMVITGVEGEQHQVGPNMVADVLESAGWDVRFLGTNAPAAGVLQAVEEHRADVLGISATMLFNLPSVRRLIADVRALPGRKLRVILGGSAFRAAPDLYRELGAAGVALDVRAALRLVATL
jgi:MerR family transcriptional regulator, light-induced transcriptional regulator